MSSVTQAVAQDVPEALVDFVRETCRLSIDDFRACPPNELPARDRQLLVHAQDMTSTLANFHGSPLRVDLLQRRQSGDLYLREVFLRTQTAAAIVEYGVIAIALESFTTIQQVTIQAGHTPLGEVLHRFRIPFVSAPIGFFSVAAEHLAATPLAPPRDAVLYGRFNRLTKPMGDPLAWILEILPPA